MYPAAGQLLKQLLPGTCDTGSVWPSRPLARGFVPPGEHPSALPLPLPRPSGGPLWRALRAVRGHGVCTVVSCSRSAVPPGTSRREPAAQVRSRPLWWAGPAMMESVDCWPLVISPVPDTWGSPRVASRLPSGGCERRRAVLSEAGHAPAHPLRPCGGVWRGAVADAGRGTSDEAIGCGRCAGRGSTAPSCAACPLVHLGCPSSEGFTFGDATAKANSPPGPRFRWLPCRPALRSAEGPVVAGSR